MIHPLWKNKRTGQLWCASEWMGEILLSWQRGSGVAPVSATRRYGSLAEVEARYAPSGPCGYLIRDGQTTIGACERAPGHDGEHMRGAPLHSARNTHDSGNAQ